MITQYYAASASGRVLPLLSFDFTSAILDSRISVIRALNTATAINSSGYIASINANLPRFDFDPVSLICNGLLIEESRTNLFLQSQDFTNSPWSNVGVGTVIDGAAIGPDNTASACALTPTSGGGVLLNQSVTVTAAPHTITLYAKQNGITSIGFASRDNPNLGIANFNLLTGVATTQSGATSASMSIARNGFWRCVATFTPTLGASNRYRISTPIGDGIKSVLIYGAGLELGSFPTSYIPTTTAAVTRNADVATITGTNFSDWWQAGKGSALALARPSTVSGTRPLIQFDDTTTDNIIALRGNTTNPELYVRTGGSDQAQIDAGTIAANVRYRLAGAWATNSCSASVNSGTPVLDGVATIPAVTQARLGSDGTNYLNGHLEAIEYYEERVPNSSLQVVSSAAGYRSIIGPVFRDTIIS